MKVAGIIAEYNPFHNGHKFHIDEVRRKTGADYVVVVMSGDFVQRGGPAIVDKRTRAKMALLSGADLVLELPVIAACASAETFARTGVGILNALGVVTHLGFGCETCDLDLLQSLAALFDTEPDDYKELLSSYMKQGLSFPSARAKAANAYLKDVDGQIEEVLNNPNNILGIEYIKALRQFDSKIIPCGILRQGNHYADEDLTGTLSSATAIRKELYRSSEEISSHLWAQIPKDATLLLKEYFTDHVPIREDHFSQLLHYRLLGEKDRYEEYYDCKGDLSNRILNHLESYTSYSSFVDLLKTKNQTYTGISRALLHLLLGIKDTHYQDLADTGFAPYARVLGFRKASAGLLKALDKGTIPVITKLSQDEVLLSETDPVRARLLQLDISCSHIYNTAGTALVQASEKNEYRQSLVFI